jgi:hypothetical protein
MHSNAGFPLGEFVCAFSFVETLLLTCKAVATKENVAWREQIHLVENKLN